MGATAMIDTKILKSEERAVFALRALYRQYGYLPYKMSKFESYEYYIQNKDFLVSDRIITFNDTNGRLLALKPDVTLSIIKNGEDCPGCKQKVCYNEHVYRVSGNTHQFKEIMQAGLECIGDIDLYNLCEVIFLAAQSLRTIDANYVLDLSHMGVVSALVDALALDDERRAAVLDCIAEKNGDGVRRLCPDRDVSGILALIAAYGPAEAVIETLRPWCNEGDAKSALDELEQVTRVLSANGCDGVRVDFSIVNDMNYYNDIVFMGYIRGIPTGVLSGGQYDNMMRRMGRDCRAVGFAIYMDQLERLNDEPRPYDVDTLVLYDEGADVAALTRAVNGLTREGASVRAQKALDSKLRYRRLLRFGEGGIQYGE
jgi:ATP phosphoribosyltransferase regulatory subunit